jgi:hypothetical protein
VLAHRTKQDVDAGTRGLEIERAQLEQSYRPVLMPAIVEPHDSGDGMVLAFENIGVGPAIQMAVGVDLNDGSGLTDIQTHPAVGARASIDFQCFTSRGFASGVPPFSFEIRYRDVAGKTWRTEGDWEPPDKWSTKLPAVLNAGAYPDDFLDTQAWG